VGNTSLQLDERRRKPSPNTIIICYVILGVSLGSAICFLPEIAKAFLMLFLAISVFVLGWIDMKKIWPNYSTRHEWRRDTLLYYLNPKDPPRLGNWGRFKGRPEEDWAFRTRIGSVLIPIGGILLMIASLIYFVRAKS
jgi:hypothetical protein